LRDRYAGWDRIGRGPRQPGRYRNGYYLRSFATVFGVIRLRIARMRGKSFLPRGIEPFRSMSEIGILRQQSFSDAANSTAFIDLPVSPT
jgi:transposase-like protein